ncbi:MAG: ATPase, T2SS/T4P/T4SS family [Desulfobulbaceae bacterium]|jgi:type IV pilus assembly protein PilB|nr:ATPase, T2SS/T4P/T4SS family [Desulfobulbaceae bacterium]
MKRKRFGDILVEGGLISMSQLEQALAYGKTNEVKLGQALLELGVVTEEAVARTIASQLHIPYVDLTKIVLDPDIVALIPEHMARKNKLIAIGKRAGEILVALSDPNDIYAMDEVDLHIKGKVIPCVAMESLLLKIIEQQYSGGTSEHGDLEQEDEGEAVAAINEVLLLASREVASDIHFEPDKNALRIRIRVDGLLKKIREYDLKLLPSLTSRIKIMAMLDIGEKRKPQDGRFEITVAGRDYDVRVSILPLNNGEKVVLRLLDKSKIKISLGDLGFEQNQQELFERHLAKPHEIILVTGPTGSGKTTTLYGALNRINNPNKNIITVEDPVEYELAGINQVQVNVKADLTFVSALRSILRQDPDIIMIGEIRDGETAEIAIQSALTGHLVMSTLHTNDSCSAVTRLLDMGIPPFLIASSLGLVLAQRLPRMLCPHCKKAMVVDEAIQEYFSDPSTLGREIFSPVGCPQCEGGFRGRVAIYELLEISEAIEKLIMLKESSRQISRQARSEGFTGIRQSGLAKVLSGQTSLDEVLRLSLDAEE